MYLVSKKRFPSQPGYIPSSNKALKEITLYPKPIYSTVPPSWYENNPNNLEQIFFVY